MTAAPPSGTHRPGLVTSMLVGLSRHTPLGRGQLRKLMARGVRAMNDGPLDVGLYGGKARLHLVNNNSEIKALLAPNHYAREEYAFCDKHMPKEGGVFLDIGGNAGVFSLYVASRMQSGTLIAAEPQPNMFARLEANLSLMNPEIAERLDLHLHQTALGAEAGVLQLSVPDSAGQASARLVEGAPVIDVPVTTMLSLLTESGADKLDLLKIDVEGFEDGILYPFFETAPTGLHPKAIVMESCHSGRWQRDCEALLLDHNYRITHKDRTNMMLEKA